MAYLYLSRDRDVLMGESLRIKRNVKPSVGSVGKTSSGGRGGGGGGYGKQGQYTSRDSARDSKYGPGPSSHTDRRSDHRASEAPRDRYQADDRDGRKGHNSDRDRYSSTSTREVSDNVSNYKQHRRSRSRSASPVSPPRKRPSHRGN